MLTATFFCESTTAQSFPRTPMAVMLAEVMALKAYSEVQGDSSAGTKRVGTTQRFEAARTLAGRCNFRVHTDLVQSTLVGEDSDMSVVACCGDGGQSGLRSWGWADQQRQSRNIPDMMTDYRVLPQSNGERRGIGMEKVRGGWREQ